MFCTKNLTHFSVNWSKIWFCLIFRTRFSVLHCRSRHRTASDINPVCGGSSLLATPRETISLRKQGKEHRGQAHFFAQITMTGIADEGERGVLIALMYSYYTFTNLVAEPHALTLRSVPQAAIILERIIDVQFRGVFYSTSSLVTRAVRLYNKLCHLGFCILACSFETIWIEVFS